MILDAQQKIYNSIKSCNITLEVACHPVSGVMDYQNRPGSSRSVVSADLNKLMEGGPESLEDKKKWQLLTNELAQKQEIIHRMMKEIDDKSSALKLTTSEIVDLRRTIKMLQSENGILRKEHGDDKTYEI